MAYGRGEDGEGRYPDGLPMDPHKAGGGSLRS